MEEIEAWEMPEETKVQVLEKIKALAWEIRNDWSDPRGECREIVRLCKLLIELETSI